MPRQPLVTAGALAAALFMAASVHAAPVITGDSFQASLTVDSVVSGPFSGVAGSAGDDIREVPAVGADGLFRVEWVDEDSVDVEFYIGGLNNALNDGSFTISGLDFQDGGTPRAITGVSFNYAESNVGTYADGGSLVGPALTFTATSFTGVLSMSEGLLADGPRLRYDLTIAAVPEPATTSMLLLGAGLCGLAARRVRRASDARPAA